MDKTYRSVETVIRQWLLREQKIRSISFPEGQRDPERKMKEEGLPKRARL